MIEYISFWFAKYATGVLILLSLITISFIAFGVWLFYKYYVYNYSREASSVRRDVINTVKDTNNGISYERLANAHGHYGHSIFDSVSIVDKPNKLKMFMYQYDKARRRGILVYQDGIIIHKDRLSGMKFYD